MTRRSIRFYRRVLGLGVAVVLVFASCSQPRPRSDRPPDERAPRGSASTEEKPGDLDVHVLGFNDFHGHLEAPAGTVQSNGETVEAGGAAHLAHTIDSFRQSHRHTATVVAGDLIGASPLVSALFHDEPTIEVMNAIGIDGAAVGNHEFDEGWRELLRIAEGGCHPKDGCREGSDYPGARFPYLAANVYGPDGKRLFDPWVVREYDGERVAFVGMVLDGIPSIVMPSAIEGLRFENEVVELEKVVPKLRERGIETIVVVIHEGGYPKDEPAQSLSGCPDLEGPIVEIAEEAPEAVDAFMTGHTHKTYVCTIDGRLVTSAMSNGRLVTEMQLTIDRRSGDVLDASARNRIVRADGPKDEEIADMVSRYTRLASEEADRVVGRVSEGLSRELDDSGESALGKVIADAQLAAARSEVPGGAQFALMNPGGIRTSLRATSDGDHEAGAVTYGELHRAQPFRNQLVVVTLTGRQIHEILENQWREEGAATMLQISKGLEYTWHPDRQPGNRVDPEAIRVEDARLEMETDYRVVVNNFLAEGGDEFPTFENGTDRAYGPIDIDAMVSYFEKNSPVSAPTDDRIRRAPSRNE